MREEEVQSSIEMMVGCLLARREQPRSFDAELVNADFIPSFQAAGSFTLSPFRFYCFNPSTLFHFFSHSLIQDGLLILNL